MRILFAIPHYFNPEAGRFTHGSLAPNPQPRIQALTECLAAIQQLFGRPQCLIDIARRTTVPANEQFSGVADVAVCTTGDIVILFRTLAQLFKRGDVSAEGHATMPEFMGSGPVPD